MKDGALQPGDQLGSFRVVGRLGAGGMGEVYRAHDDRLKREVALKVLPRDTQGDATARARLLQEASRAAGLSHPNICTVFEVGEEQGRLFIAMELIHGQPLAQRCRPSGMPHSEVVRLGSDIADALEHAHSHGVVHRDLKPANVMLGEDGRAKVMDFGLARQVATTDANTVGDSESALTERGAIVGTPHYLPPEAFHGVRTDERGDIWALGVLIYEMASGAVPFAGTTQFEVAAAIMHASPRPLAEHVPAGLRVVVARCLEKEPGRRYQHAGEVRAALDAVAFANTPTALRQGDAAAPEVPANASAAPARRAWVARVAGGLLGLLVVILIVLNVDTIAHLFRGAQIADRISALAVMPLENLSRDPEQEFFAEGMTQEISTRLARIAALRIIAQGSVAGLAKNHRSLSDIGRELRVPVLLRGSVIKVGGRVRISVQLVEAGSGSVRWANSYERQLVDVLGLQSEVALAIAHEIQVQLTPEEHSRIAASQPIDPEAYEAYLKGRAAWGTYKLEGFQESERQFKRALDLAPHYAAAWAGLADAAYGFASIFVPANEAIPRARAAAEKALALDSTLSEAHTSIGIVKMVYDWDWAGAEQEFDRAIALKPGDANAHLWRGHLLVVLGRFDEGLASIQKATDLDPLSSWLRTNVGLHLFLARRYNEAERSMRTAVASDPGNFNYYWALGIVLEQSGDHAGAVAALEKCVQIEPNNDNLAQLAHAYGTAGRKADAERVISQLLHRREQEFVPAANIAIAYAGLGKRDLAFHWLELAIEDHSEMLIFLKTSPAFDPLRSDPRFPGMLRQVHLGF